ncbi:MAG TPA: hypothetical protein VE398_25400 [Acidobacteriota bacterium]|nr:hypothetical protein [Acidobacteriota bacterium]
MMFFNRELSTLLAQSDRAMKAYEQVKDRKPTDDDDLLTQRENVFIHIWACEHCGGPKARLDAFRRQFGELDGRIKQPMVAFNKEVGAAEKAVRELRRPVVARVVAWARHALQVAPVDGEFAEMIYTGIRKVEGLGLAPGDELLKAISEFEKQVDGWTFENRPMLPALDFRDLVSEV